MCGSGLQTGGLLTIQLKKCSTQKAPLLGKTGWRKVALTCVISPIAIGIAVLLEARTRPIALRRIWDSAVQPATCLRRTDSQEEVSQIQEVTSDLHLVSLRTLSNLVQRSPTLRWDTYLPNGQRNRLARPNHWPVSVHVLYCVVHLQRSSPCFTFVNF